MITMIDELYDRAYRDSRADVNASLAGIFSGVGKAIDDSFQVLHRIEWSAPWEPKKTKRARAH